MGSAEVDRLEVAVKANATSANQQLDNLISKLNGVNSALRGANNGGLQGLANGVKTLSSAMQGLKSSGVGAADFTRLANNIQKLVKIDTASLNHTASSLRMIGKSLDGLSSVTSNAIQIGDVAKNIAKFGNKSMQSAIDIMPQLGASLRSMMSEISKTPVLPQNLVSMTSALANLTANAGKISKSATSIGNSSRKAGNGLSLFSNHSIRTAKSTKSLAISFSSLCSNVFLVIRALKRVGKFVNSSMDFVETVDYYGTVVNKISSEFSNQFETAGYDSAESYANSFNGRMQELTGKMTGYTFDMDGNATSTGIKSLNLDVNAMTDYQASIMAVTNSLGLAGETSINTAKAFSMLAADESSLRNEELSTVMTNLTSGLIGQSRALYKYGIDITNATLANYAMANGISKSISEMSQSEKMQLRLLAILDQSRVAWGNMADTLNTPANQLRVLKQNFTNLARVIGNLFMPIVSKVLPYVNALVIALQRLFTYVAGIFGIDLSGISAGMGAMDDAYSGLIDDADDLTDSTNAANAATKKLQNTVMGFDELNKLNDNTSDSGGGSHGGGGGGSIDLSDKIADALADYEKVWNEAFGNMQNKAQEMADKICDAFKRHDYKGIGTYISDGITKALESIKWQKVYTSAAIFGRGLAEFLNGLITPKLFKAVGKTIANSLNTAITFAFSFGKNFDFENLGLSIASGINGFFQNFNFKKFAKTINLWVDGIEKSIGTALKNISWKDVMSGIGDFLGELEIDTVAVLIGAFVLKYAGKVFTGTVFKTIIGTMLGNKFSEAFGASAVNSALSSAGAVAADFVLPVSACIVICVASLMWGDDITKKVSEWITKQKISDKDYDLAQAFNFGSGSDWNEKYASETGWKAPETITERIAALFGKWDGESEQLKTSVIIDTEEAFKSLDGLKKKITESSLVISDLKTSFKDLGTSYTSSISSAEEEATRIKKLSDRYFELSEKTNKTAKEKKQFKTIAEELVSYLPTLEKSYDSTTGAIGKTKKEVNDLIDAQLEEIKTEAKREYLKSLYVEYEKAVQALKTAHNDYSKALEENSSKFGMLETQLKNGQITKEEYNKKIKELGGAIKDSAKNFEDCAGIVDKTGESINGLTSDMYGQTESLSSYDVALKDSTGNMSKHLLELKGNTDGAVAGVTAALGNYQKSVGEKLPKTKQLIDSNSDSVNVLGQKIKTNTVNAQSDFSLFAGVANEKLAGAKKSIDDNTSSISIFGTKVKNNTDSAKSNYSLFANIASDKLKQSKSAVDKNSNALDSFGNKAKSNSEKATGSISAFSKKSSSDFTTAKAKAGNLTTELDKTTNSAKDLYKQSGKTFTVNANTGPLSILGTAIQGVIDKLKGLFEFNGKTLNVGTSTPSGPQQNASGGVYSGGKWHPVQKYAMGGLPDMGQYFIAREAGPELVGTIGRHSAVVNNDQIVASVSNGVADAVASVMLPLIAGGHTNNSAPSIEVTIKAGSETIYRTMQNAIEDHNGRYHVVAQI